MTKRVIPALIILILGFVLVLPDEYNIGIMILDVMDETLCSEPYQNNVACQQMFFYKIIIRLIGILIFVGDVGYIVTQIRKGNF